MTTSHDIRQPVRRLCHSVLLGILLCGLNCARAQSVADCTEQVLSAPTENSVKVRLIGVNQWPNNPICVWSASGVRTDGNSYRWRAVFSGDGLVDGPSVNATVVFLYEINGSVAKSLVRNFLFSYPSGPFTAVADEADPDTSQGYPAMAVRGSITLDAASNLTLDITFTGGSLPPIASIAELIAMIESSSVSERRKRPLLTTLEAATVSLADGECDKAIARLQAFQNKVRAQVRRTDAMLAEALIADAQAVIDSACSD